MRRSNRVFFKLATWLAVLLWALHCIIAKKLNSSFLHLLSQCKVQMRAISFHLERWNGVLPVVIPFFPLQACQESLNTKQFLGLTTTKRYIVIWAKCRCQGRGILSMGGRIDMLIYNQASVLNTACLFILSIQCQLGSCDHNGLCLEANLYTPQLAR